MFIKKYAIKLPEIIKTPKEPDYMDPIYMDERK